VDRWPKRLAIIIDRCIANPPNKKRNSTDVGRKGAELGSSLGRDESWHKKKQRRAPYGTEKKGTNQMDIRARENGTKKQRKGREKEKARI
jgi:hypothetical protein